MPKTFVSIGSNLEREEHIPQALAELEETFGPLSVSSVYESEAEGFEGPPFYNLVVGFDTELSRPAVLEKLKEIEHNHGRGPQSRKFASRTLDLDLILYGDLILEKPDSDRLQLPREDILRYAFVLEPLNEITPERRHPVTGKTYRAHWQAFDPGKVKQRRLPLSVIGYAPRPRPESDR
ncbi:2-amino-4-hydroxy-6-hydroxymethyldihydropteridine diphosphokinase [Methylohalobius crimeensis]|uniref:2-amino-4-hydroxy-6- hydroxymethyldihydropteridine diphosphokinase n=1 Tax=Methylohalobius crimeensis TaxID=244365 RepID=UPI0003B31716|nr:2-amino-4-hydroxy-6-hydroxymethyldihydropteridine diphosphokinase [Methylohalobius crimeensis]